MKIVVFGASGKVGSIVIDLLLGSGHEVVAFMRSPKSNIKHPRLRIQQGDIYNETEVENAVQGVDVVISALGSWGTPKKDILTAAMKNVIPAMKTHNVSRIVSLTGSEARASGDTLSLLHRVNHLGITIVANKVLSDGESHISLLEQSDLSWTVVRSPVMTSKSISDYVLNDKRPNVWNFISRQAVAKAMVDLAISNEHEKSAPYIWCKI